MSQPTPGQIPLVTIELFDQRISVHKGVVRSLRRIEEKWRAKGGHAAYEINKVDDDWGYAHRKKRGGSSWSEHARGWAVDINSTRNPMGKRLVTDMPAWFVQIWESEGWGWGGNWRSVKDAMHFSKAPAEGGDGKLENYVDKEADWFTMATKEDLKEVVDEALKPFAAKIADIWKAVGDQKGGKYKGDTEDVDFAKLQADADKAAKAADKPTPPTP